MSKNKPTRSEPGATMRLQRYIASCGVCSRRNAEELITAGKVKVNGVIVSELGAKVNPTRDRVEVKGKLIEPASSRVFLFYKPSGVVTTAKETHGRASLADYVKELDVRVFPVGRLDMDVSGLLVLTNDGDYSQSLQHPRFEVPRTYWALVRGTVAERTLRQLLRGIALKDGGIAVSSAKFLRGTRQTLSCLGPCPPQHTMVELTVAEGRKHLVKRLFTHVGHPVQKLCRVSYGPYQLSTLSVGEIREVSKRDMS